MAKSSSRSRRAVPSEKPTRQSEHIASQEKPQSRRKATTASKKQQARDTTGNEALSFSARACVLQGDLEESFGSRIDRAVIRKNGLSFDWKVDDGDVEGVQMSTHDGINYHGKAIMYPGTRDQVITEVEGVLYANHRGRLLVCQCINADGEEESWLIQFFDGQTVEY